MEQKLVSDFQQILKNERKLSQKALSIARSLIVNPLTSNYTITSILETLKTLSPEFHHFIITLLHEISTIHHHHNHHRFNFSSNIPTCAAGLLALNFSNSEELFLSLCFSSCVAVRQRLLFDVAKFDIRPSVLVTVLLGFTKDPYLYVRKAAMDGLCKCIVVVEDVSIIQGCYLRGVDLLIDTDESVRCSAVHMVRSSACYSLRMPAVLFADFAAKDLGLLMDMLNDDSTVVRLQALETMHHMVVFGHLKVQEMHMHMAYQWRKFSDAFLYLKYRGSR